MDVNFISCFEQLQSVQQILCYVKGILRMDFNMAGLEHSVQTRLPAACRDPLASAPLETLVAAKPNMLSCLNRTSEYRELCYTMYFFSAHRLFLASIGSASLCCKSLRRQKCHTGKGGIEAELGEPGGQLKGAFIYYPIVLSICQSVSPLQQLLILEQRLDSAYIIKEFWNKILDL